MALIRIDAVLCGLGAFRRTRPELSPTDRQDRRLSNSVGAVPNAIGVGENELHNVRISDR